MTNSEIRVAERMDDGAVDQAELEKALRFIRRINAALGYNRAVVREVAGLAGDRKEVSVLDVACGSGDLPSALRRWGDRHGKRFNTVGLDRHAITASIAAASGLTVVRGDALALPLADRSVDIVTCNLFLHHLPDEQTILTCLAEMARVCRLGYVVADLIHNRRALAWIKLFTLFSSPLVRHDAVTSVRQAMTEERWRALVKRMPGRTSSAKVAFGHRYLIMTTV